jgi:4-amino-4-deoxy-L-arabinose transferase-like glycosyltransferase
VNESAATHEQGARAWMNPRWYLPALAVIVLISLFLDFFRLGQDGYGNLYYAAAVKSMLMSWHNFFFVSFDPAGFVSVDKPPLAFWIQAASASVFGFTPWSILLPQALAGVLSVALLAHLVRRSLGVWAALLAAFALAVMPINVVTNRNLTMDSVLVFVLLLAAWAVIIAAESGKLRFLLLGVALVGIGFNIKMLDAYLILPAFGLLYWFSAPHPKKVRFYHLLLAVVVLIPISFCWAVAVDLTPAPLRPFVGSSTTNSEVQLALLYNGGSRVFGNIKELSLLPAEALIEIQERLPPFARPTFWLGKPGIFRLIIPPLGQQIGWLLPLALLGIVAVRWDKPSFWPLNKQQQALALWGGWFLTQFIFFSGATFTHQYYLVQLAPSLCALLAMGVVITWRVAWQMNWKELWRASWQDVKATFGGWLLPLALVGTAILQVFLIDPWQTGWQYWPIPLLTVGAIVWALLARPSSRMRSIALAIGLCMLCVVPVIWSAIPVLEDRNVDFPYAGPTVAMTSLEVAVSQTDDEMVPDGQLVSFLQAHQGKTPYIMATSDASIAAPVILQTGKAVMTMGGYSGGDQILSVEQLKHYVANGSVRYFVFTQTIDESHLSPQLKEYQRNYSALVETSGIGNIDPLMSWVRTQCRAVPQEEWHPPAPVSKAPTLLDVFDCAGQH